MKIQNIFALIVTLIGFAACSSESEIPNTPIDGELVPVTISLGSLQTRASVGLGSDEGNIENAVIAIFDASGTPVAAPIVLENGTTTGTTRIPLASSKAYAFANVSDADIEALVNLAGDENNFKGYTITKSLSQNAAENAAELPKFGSKSFIPTNETINIPVNQLTARVEALVEVKVIKDGSEVSSEEEEKYSFSKTSLVWTNMDFKNNSTTSTEGNNGSFETTINGATYSNVLNRAYSYPGAQPTISIEGAVSTPDGASVSIPALSYTFVNELVADNVYLVKFVAKVDVSTPTNITITYEVVPAETIPVTVPSFD